MAGSGLKYTMKKAPTVKSVMTAFPHHVSVDDSLEHAQQMMADHDIHHLPVVDDGELVGVLSDRDVHRVREMAMGAGMEGELKVVDACVRDVYVVDLHEPLVNVLATMAERHIGSVLITRHGRLAGLFTGTDACRVFADHLREHFGPAGGDSAA